MITGKVNVTERGGAEIMQHCLQAELVDEFLMHLV